MTDAELSIGVSDEFTPTLKSMQKSVEEFGKSAGISLKSVEKYNNSLEKSFATLATQSSKLSGTGLMGDQGKNRRDVEASTKAQEEYNKSISRMVNIQQGSDGKLRDGATGRFTSQAEQIKREEAAIDSMAQAQKRYGAQQDAVAQRALQHNQQQLNGLRATGAGAESAHQKTQAFYNDLFQAREPFPKNMFAGAEKGLGSIMNASNGVRYALYDVSRTFAIAGAAAIAMGLVGVGVAAKWEHAFAQVDRVTEGSRTQIELIRQELIGLSTSMPVGFTALSQIATDAGQLGISRGGVAAFTETVARMTATTSLSAEAAGRALGRFKAFFPVVEGGDATLAVTEKTFGNLASSILKVGVNSVATETGIVNVATQISSMGSYAGLTADQVIGLSGAMSSIGVPPELSRGVLTRLFTTMGGAVSAGGIKLEKFAEISGVTSAEFAKAWQTENFAPVLNGFTKGLNSIAHSGGDANAALKDLGITAVRDVPTLLRLAKAADSMGNSGGLLAQTLADARSGWRDNTEMAVQYAKIAGTLTSRLTILGNSFEGLFAAMGESSVGPARDLVDLLTDMVQGVTQVAASPLAQWLGPVATGLSVVVGVLLLAVAGMARMGAATQGMGTALAALRGQAAVTTATLQVLSKAMLFTGIGVALAVIGVAMAAISLSADQAGDAIKNIDSGSLLAAMEQDAKDGARGLEFFAQANSDAAKETELNKRTADGLAKALGKDVVGATDSATKGLDSMKEAANSARYVFGDAARDLVRSSIIADEGIQEVFSNTNYADIFQKAGITFDDLIDVSSSGGSVSAYLEKEFGDFAKKGGYGSALDMFADNGLSNLYQLNGMNKEIEDSVKGLQGKIQGQINLRNVLGGESEMLTYAEEAFSKLDEVTQKQIEKTAGAMAKFVDPSKLIKFTQDSIDASKLSGEEGEKAAAALDKAWTDAYGGSSFAISDYMKVFTRASEEQMNQIAGLQALSARGLDASIMRDLADMGPESARLVQALVASTDAELDEFVALWGKTGYDSQVALATQAAIGQEIVNNVFAAGGLTALREFNSKLASGYGVDDALRAMQRDVDGIPITVKTQIEADRVAAEWAAYLRATGGGVVLPVRPVLTQKNIVAKGAGPSGAYNLEMYANGGYTGNGGKYDPAGTVHRGEFVMDKESTSRIGVGPLYAMMRAARGGTPAARPGGYAGGGAVGGSGTGMVQLSPADRMLLVEIRDAVGVTIGAPTLEAVVRGGNMNDSKRRSG